MRKITGGALARHGLSTSSIESLLRSLRNENAGVRRDARALLIAMGEAAVPYLIAELNESNEHIRWEAAKALSEIKHGGSVEALVYALLDQSEDVRWVAGEGLISIGVPALEPLLRELAYHYNSVEFRTGATHVLHALSSVIHYDTIRPVLISLEKNYASYKLPVAAYEAWDTLRRSHSSSASY